MEQQVHEDYREASFLKSLKNIYENSNFYNEARIVSFIDRLLESIVAKIKAKMTVNLSVTRGMKDYEVFV